MNPLRLAVLSLVLTAAAAHAEPEQTPQKLSVFVGAGSVGSPDSYGGSLNTGIRLGLSNHFAASFDLGYGLIATPHDFQDRWWLIPSVAFVIPAGRVRFDLGAGVGLATSSGYSDAAEFFEAPFNPRWALQLVPAARGHVMASAQLTKKVDVFARLDVGSLLLDGNTIGFRDNKPRTSLTDTMWINLWLGVNFGVL